MKVLILTPDIYTRGGIARYTATLASALGELIGPENVHVQPLLGAGGSGESSPKYRVLDPITSRLTAASKLRFAAKALALGRRKYDLTICTHIGLSPVAGLARLLFRTPYWVSCHGIESWKPLPIAEREALRHAHTVIPISRFTAQKIVETNGVSEKKIRILYNAVPDEFASLSARGNGEPPGTNGHKKCLLSVGMLSKGFSYKGFDTVIRALPKILEITPNLRYVIVGEGNDKERLKKLAVETGVSKYVEFTGEISDLELAARYQDCDVFVLPSRVRQSNGNWEGEGFGRVYVEAALAGKPVVGSRDGGAAEAVLHGKTGLLVDPSSVTEVADALLTLLHDPGLAARMGSEGQHWARENFTASALRRRLGEMLRGIRNSTN